MPITEDTTTTAFVARVVRDHGFIDVDEWALGLDGLANMSDVEIEFLARQWDQLDRDRALLEACRVSGRGA